MVQRYLISSFLIFVIANHTFGQASVMNARTTQGNLEATINNIGLLGNSFRGNYASGWGSLRYPATSKTEHAFLGGLWVGAKIDGTTVAVSTGAANSSAGYSTGAQNFEFTAPVGSVFAQKSLLLDNPNYNPTAVSHQDYISYFTDSNFQVPGTQLKIVNHNNPLKISVKFESYNWNFNSANYFVALDFEITNMGTSKLDSVYVGYWIDFVIRDVSIFPPGGTPFFSSGGNGYIDTLYTAYEWDAENGATPNARSYAGIKFLGAENKNGFLHPKATPNFKCSYNTWFFNSNVPNYFTPRSDIDYYGKMRSGLNELSNWSSIQSTIAAAGNRSNLLSVGPFGTINPGEKIKATFGIICAASIDDGQLPYLNTATQRSEFVSKSFLLQKSYNGEDANFNGILDTGEDVDKNNILNRWVFPVPPDVPKTKVVTTDNQIDVYLTSNSKYSIDPVTKTQDFEGYRIYKTQLGFDMQDEKDVQKNLKLVASFDTTGNQLFFDNGFDSIRLSAPVKFEGDSLTYTHKYTFKNIASGWQHAISVTAFDKGNAAQNTPSLESSLLANVKRVFPGRPANASLKSNAPFAYPNPYYGLAAWEGGSKFEESRKLMFSNLPSKCKVRIYTFSGDLVDEFEHNSAIYNGSDARWYTEYSNTQETVFSGGEHAWDLLTKESQLIARGFYTFSVEDTQNGNTTLGKFYIAK